MAVKPFLVFLVLLFLRTDLSQVGVGKSKLSESFMSKNFFLWLLAQGVIILWFSIKEVFKGEHLGQNGRFLSDFSQIFALFLMASEH